MKEIRITYRREILIKADSKEEAEQIFEAMDEHELHSSSEFIEVSSIEEED